jgi:citrate lyase subunit beta / citryl-CoA lyase
MPSNRSRRCVLAVPGSNPRMMAKAASLRVDQVMLDLEDAVADNAKVAARATVIAALGNHDWSEKILSVRVNARSTRWFEDDVREVVGAAGDAIDTVVMPKADDADDVLALASLLDDVETERGLERRVGIEPQIESARGLCFAERIAFAHERVESLTFGPADFAASIGSPVLAIGEFKVGYPGHVWHYALSRIVVAAKAAGLVAIDGPYGNIDDSDGLRESAQLARILGCDGKWAIHPSQIEPLTLAFTPSDEELARAREIAARYETATTGERTGAVKHGGELLDAASLRLAKSTLSRDAGPRRDLQR